jgi:hypothetical protein
MSISAKQYQSLQAEACTRKFHCAVSFDRIYRIFRIYKMGKQAARR